MLPLRKKILKIHFNLLLAVADALREIFERGQYADRVLERLLKSNPRWGARDRAFIAENTYDIVRYWEQVKVHIPEDAPDRFLFSAGVWLTLKGIALPAREEFSNLDIRKIQENHLRFLSDPLYREALPAELFAIVESELGKEKSLEIFTEMNKPARLYVRANTLKTDRKTFTEVLNEDGLQAEHLRDDVFILAERANVFKKRTFQEGFFEIQDAHSQAIATYTDVKPGMRVVDACAGAGGKSLHLAALMQNRGKIISLDTERFKLEELKRRAKRAGANIIETRPIENSKVIKRLYDTADRLLLDVPCSGLGVLKRNPDAKQKIDAAFIARVREQQVYILENYSKICRRGGKMVYATCSILPSENEKQTENFLQKNPDFVLISQQTLYPSAEGDGFYMALMERKK
jgi:16S rRNA (cytosine967-C5)-methyltransferase